jgi:hypothetical protein
MEEGEKTLSAALATESLGMATVVGLVAVDIGSKSSSLVSVLFKALVRVASSSRS